MGRTPGTTARVDPRVCRILHVVWSTSRRSPRCCREITRPERRHCAFLLTAARERGGAISSVEARLTRWVLEEMWEPPGVPSLGLDHVARPAFAPFIDDTTLRARVAEMDRIVDAIPHLADLHLMQRFLEQRVPLAWSPAIPAPGTRAPRRCARTPRACRTARR